MKQLTVGILAHVDAGKTTLSEALLYSAGTIRRLGRVDHRDSFLDTDGMERERGITIFSKSARMTVASHDTEITLLDTPGHVDFSAEAERTLRVLDYAILVISGTSGVQNHTETLWSLLRRYRVPTLMFVNKTDLPGVERAALMAELRARLDEGCIDFSDDVPDSTRGEAVALLDEAALEQYTTEGTVGDDVCRRLTRERRLFPCWFGSALRMSGVEAFLKGFLRYTEETVWGAAFGARVYKITHDQKGVRLTHLRVTGGRLSVRDPITYGTRDSAASLTEKVGQLRLYSGDKFVTADTVAAGMVCAVAGLSGTYAGQGLGAEADARPAVLEPVLSCRMVLPPDADVRTVLPKLRLLEEEDPELHVVFREALREVAVQLMGEVQTETLRTLLAERFGLTVTFGEGQILYKETVAAPVEGVGHFEPLRHYAEVHLLLEPLPPGSGLQFASACRENDLGLSWQRLVLTHLAEKTHRGVLTGAPLTDVRITLLAGRAHIKHTEGGDFREATYRAVRQGLMRAESVLLEPVYSFRLEVPTGEIGRAITDIRNRCGSFESPVERDGMSLLCGRAPVSTMRNYAVEVTAYTKGRGRLQCTVSGYAPCHNTAEVVATAAYRPEADLANTPDSVFCAKGAGFTVKWDQVPSYMNLDSGWKPDLPPGEVPRPRLIDRNTDADARELETIMDREFGPIRRRVYSEKVVYVPAPVAAPPSVVRQKYVLVDGYNVIFSWNGLRQLAAADLAAAREALTDILINYAGFTHVSPVLVFDAYRVRENPGHRDERSGVTVVFTREGETGDAYIEKLVHEIGKSYEVRVVTSDALIQISAVAAGVLRMSATEFEAEVERANTGIAEFLRRLAEKSLSEFFWPDPPEDSSSS